MGTCWGVAGGGVSRVQSERGCERAESWSWVCSGRRGGWRGRRLRAVPPAPRASSPRSELPVSISAPVSISDVETVREGHQSEVLQSLAEEFPPERCFTIVFYGRRGNLDLIAGSAEEAQCWVQGLRQLIEVATSMDQRERIDQYPSRGHCPALPPSPALPQHVLSF